MLPVYVKSLSGCERIDLDLDPVQWFRLVTYKPEAFTAANIDAVSSIDLDYMDC